MNGKQQSKARQGEEGREERDDNSTACCISTNKARREANMPVKQKTHGAQNILSTFPFPAGDTVAFFPLNEYRVLFNEDL